MKLANSNGRKNERRIQARLRLEQRLTTDERILSAFEILEKPTPAELNSIRYLEKQIARQRKEIAILNERIVFPAVAIVKRTKKYRGPESIFK